MGGAGPGASRPGWRAGGKRAHGGARGTPRGVPRAAGAGAGSRGGVRQPTGRARRRGAGRSTGSPRWVKMVAITRGSAMVANTRSRPPQSGHASTIAEPTPVLCYAAATTGRGGNDAGYGARSAQRAACPTGSPLTWRGRRCPSSSPMAPGGHALEAPPQRIPAAKIAGSRRTVEDSTSGVASQGRRAMIHHRGAQRMTESNISL